MRTILKRGRVWMVMLSTGGGLLALEGCDPAVRATVLSGLGSAASGLATTFIQAFVESLNQEAEDDSTPTTVQAKPFVPDIFA